MFAYFILFGYTWLLIGPIPVQSLINVAMTMFGFGLILFFFYVVGSGMLGASGPCVRPIRPLLTSPSPLTPPRPLPPGGHVACAVPVCAV